MSREGVAARSGQPVGIARGADRRITLGGLVVSGLYLVAALAACAFPVETRRGAWLPLHLALAGGATTAIASAMPFFTSALSAAPPAAPVARLAVIGAVASGALGVVLGVVGAAPALATVAGATFVLGVAGLGLVTFAPLRRAVGPRRGLIGLAYGAAIVNVVAGAGLATLLEAGWSPVADRWLVLKPAHGWLNLFGFVSLVVVGTLLHLFPTVAGSRMARRPSATLAVRALVVGAPLAALGYAASSAVLAVAGGAAELAGAAGLAAYLAASWRSRAGWTTDAGWHRFTSAALGSAATWFVVSVAIVFVRLLAFGAEPAGWEVATFAGPLVAGWVVMAILGAATHLLPAIGPGGPDRHRRQRATLGRLAGVRLGLLDGGVGLLAIGLPFGSPGATAAGAVIAGLGLGLSVGLLGRATLVRDGEAGKARR